MTQPRCILKGATYLVTRRCVDRQFLLVPRGQTTTLFAYSLAKSLKTHDVDLHSVTVMPNHWHAVVTDRHGVIDRFARDCNSLSARSLNAHYGRTESLWSSQGLSVVRLETPEDVMDKMVYTTMNPVKAGLVESPVDWPGLRTLPSAPLHRPRVIERPKTRFYARSRLPEQVELEVKVPPQFAKLGTKEFVRRFQERVGDEVEARRAERRLAGTKVMGARAVSRQRRDARPKTAEARGKRDPAVACKNKEIRVAALRALRIFRVRYREAWRRFITGEAGVIFPAGTLLMARLYGVTCERAPPFAY